MLNEDINEKAEQDELNKSEETIQDHEESRKAKTPKEELEEMEDQD